MADVIFYQSPINIKETIKYSTRSKTIFDLLYELQIHNEPLAVRINGKSPDELDLNHEINEKDLIEIARVVHGGSYGSNRTIAGFLQFASVAVAFIPGIGTLASIGIQIGLNLAAGYFNAKAAKIKASEASSIEPQEEAEINGNSTSPINASNEVRANQPMMIIMGSIRVAPDIHQLPLKSFAGGGFIPVQKDFYDTSQTVFNFGVGDISIGVRRIQKILLTQFQPSFETHDIQKDADWSFDISEPLWYPLYVWKEVPGAELKNEDGFTSSNIAYTDQGKYNFVRFDGPINFNKIRGTMKGRCYFASNTGMQNNGGTGQFELQVRRSDVTTWQDRQIFDIQNNNTKDIFANIQYDSVAQDPNLSTQFRIRKKTDDDTDNTGQRVMEFRVDSLFFGREVLPSERYGLNLVGLEMNAAQKLNVSDPKFSALCTGSCWVWDTINEEWSWQVTRNPAWWFKYFANGMFLSPNDPPGVYPDSPTYWITTNPENPENIERIFGAGLTDAQLDIEKIKEWAQFCDDNNIYFDYVLKDNISCAEMLERIANIGRGYTTYYKGILGVIWEAPNQIPVGMYGMGNIIAGSFSVQYNVSDIVSKVIGTFVDRDRDWETFQVEADVPYADAENYRFLEVVLDGITEEQQAQREVNILAARQYYQRRTYTWKVDHEGLIAKRGDVVYLSHDATQYGYSGRIKKFNLESGNVVSIETTSLLEDTTINHVTIRSPDGTLNIYECTVSDNVITFVDPYPINEAPVYIDTETDNNSSDYPNSMPDDFIFIAGAKETPGKIVRISEIKADQDFNFTITAVDEDPAMWSYEFNDLYITPPEPESFDDSEVVCKIDNLQYFNLGNGLVKIMWENLNSDFIKIINDDTELPIEADGSFSFSGGEVILELDPGHKYTLRIEPFVVGTAYRMESRTITLWA